MRSWSAGGETPRAVGVSDLRGEVDQAAQGGREVVQAGADPLPIQGGIEPLDVVHGLRHLRNADHARPSACPGGRMGGLLW